MVSSLLCMNIYYTCTHICVCSFITWVYLWKCIFMQCVIIFGRKVSHHVWELKLWNQAVCVCSVAQSCPILWDPMNCSPPGSSVYGALQARILEWVAMPSSRGIFLFTGRTRGYYVSCTGRQVLYCWSQAILVLTAVLILTLVMCCLGGLDGNFSVPQFLYL